MKKKIVVIIFFILLFIKPIKPNTFTIYPENFLATDALLDSTAITNKEILLGEYYFTTNGGDTTKVSSRTGTAIKPNTDVILLFKNIV